MGKIDKNISAILNKHKIIGLDTMVFIYHFEESDKYLPLTLPIFKNLESGNFQGITSVLTKLEILVKPKQENNYKLANTYNYLLNTFPNLRIDEITSKAIDIASDLRAEYKIKTPDAIQIAVSMNSKATCFISNDHALKKIDEIEILTMEDFL